MMDLMCGNWMIGGEIDGAEVVWVMDEILMGR